MVVRFPEGKSVVLEFVGEFEIESHSSCSYDFIEIRNGTTSDSPILMKICGNTNPKIRATNGNSIWIKFRSDSGGNKNGFGLKVTQINIGEGNENIKISTDVTYLSI